MIKVNIGSGFVGQDDWINLDKSLVARIARLPFLVPLLVRLRLLPRFYREVHWPRIKFHDCRKKLPFFSDEVDCIYTSHFLEHVYRHQALAILKECRRILKPGGVVRIVVPDVKKLALAYLDGRMDKIPTSTPDDPDLKFTDCDRLVMQFYPAELNYVRPLGRLLKAREICLARHKWMYDYDSLRVLLKEAGLENIREMNAGQSEIENIDRLDLKPDVSLYVEANKQ
jgi:SAM-dependent methyltransferase